MALPFVTSAQFRMIFPLFLLGIIFFGMDNIILVTQANWGLAANLPYFFLITAFLLCSVFKQGRIAMISMAMLMAYFVIQNRLQIPLSSGSALIELSLLAFLLPSACFIVYLFNATGMHHRSIAVYISVLATLLLWSYVFLGYFNEVGVEQWGKGILFSIPYVSKLPFILVAYSIGVVLSTAILVLMHNRPIEVVIYSCLLFASVTFIFFDVKYISSTMFSLAGILLIIYVISASHELAFIDVLTQSPGRRALEMDLKHLGRKFAIAMIDVDHFKKFNDTYGHDTGDDVLKLVGSRLLNINGGAKVYRYGGEEFVVVFKGKSARDVEEYLDDIRADIESYKLVIRDDKTRPDDHIDGKRRRGNANDKPKTVNVTVSIGLSDSRTSKDPDAIRTLADEALYQAKKAGRNQVKIKLE
ncbi:GGDEF domain-containing protein [Vibrio navarrensis]|uniref:GGDEF domain-containing protein n=1 Tax=Vibrio navarrensis TaxID=29495 RepID=UPI00192F4E82|nr:GGDEF domain-containing protein [Vibrio navarrensis]MBE3668393.1 GGDEF domain-containing protein [Vibrio navarrensis]